MPEESLAALRQRYYQYVLGRARDPQAFGQPFRVWQLLVDLYLDLVPAHTHNLEGRWLAEHLVWLAKQELPFERLLVHLLTILEPGPS